MKSSSIREFQDGMSKLGVEGILLNTSEITRSTNLKHLTGFTGSDASLLISPYQADLFTDGRYKSQSILECSNLKIHITRNKIKSLTSIITRLNLKTMGLEGSRISYDFITRLSKSLPHIRFISLNRRVFENLRIFKGSEQLEKIKSAAQLASSVCLEVISKGLAGRRESEIAATLESLFRERGASGVSFPTIVASGHRSALPHGSASSKIVEPGDLVIIDYGCVWSEYCSDETVSCIVQESPNAGQQKIYLAVRNAHDSAIEALHPGVKAKDVDRIARDSIASAGLGDKFLHSLGHGVGLEVHEAPYLSPKSNEKLESGMVFTIEPGVYVENVGGVRLESLVHLSDTGPEILSSAPKELIRTS